MKNSAAKTWISTVLSLAAGDTEVAAGNLLLRHRGIPIALSGFRREGSLAGGIN